MSERLSLLSVCRSLPTPDDPSSGVFVFNRLNALQRQSDVRVLQPLPYFPAIRPLPTWAQERGRRLQDLEIAATPMFYFPGMLKSLDALWLARAILPPLRDMRRQRPIDAIDAHFGYPEGAGCVRVARRLDLPVFITIRGFENEYVERPWIGRQLVNALRSATGCIAVSHSLRDLALRHGVAPERVTVVHNAIDAANFNYGEPAAARERLGLPQDARLIVSVGHLIMRKRHHVLLEALARLRREHSAARLAIIGSPSFEPAYVARLKAAVRELRLTDAVHFLGNIPPRLVADWLRAADVFALGTAREGCCNAVLEALASGTPTVTTPVGDNAHFVESAVNGYLADVDDAVSLARRISNVLERSDWDREAISRRLLSQVGSWDDVARRVLDFMWHTLDARKYASRPIADGVRTAYGRAP